MIFIFKMFLWYFRNSINGPVVTQTRTPLVVTCNETVWIWISWTMELFIVGQGPEIGIQPFMIFNYPKHPPINFMSVGSADVPWATWTIPNINNNNSCSSGISFVWGNQCIIFLILCCRNSSRGLPELAQNEIIYMNKNGKN